MKRMALAIWVGGVLGGGLMSSVEANQALVSFLKGKAETQNKTILQLGASVPAGSMITTFKDTRVEFKLADGSVIRLGPETSMWLKEITDNSATRERTVRVEAQKGKVWLNVARQEGWTNQFSLRTPSAVAAVKGTVFRADVGVQGDQMNVYDGTVEVKTADGQPLAELNQNEMIPAGGNKKFAIDVQGELNNDVDGWIKWNKSRDQLRVMIVIGAETRVGAQRVINPFGAQDAENFMMEEFSKRYMFQVVDREQLEKLKEQAKVKAAMQNKDQSAIAAAGLELGADIVVNGFLNISQGRNLVGDMITVTANLAGKALRADTAVPIAFVPTTHKVKKADGTVTDELLSGRGADVTEEAAGWKAIRQHMPMITASLIAGVMKGFQRDAKSGTSLNVIVTGVDFQSLNALKDALSGLPGVKKIENPNFIANRALLIVTTEVDSGLLAKAVGDVKLAGWNLTVVGVSLNSIELDLSKSK